jgi:hypothetical protein
MEGFISRGREQEKEKYLSKLERRKEKRKKEVKKTQQVNLVFIKSIKSRGRYFNRTKIVKVTDIDARFATNLSIVNVFHIIVKCKYMETKKIPVSTTCFQ